MDAGYGSCCTEGKKKRYVFFIDVSLYCISITAVTIIIINSLAYSGHSQSAAVIFYSLLDIITLGSPTTRPLLFPLLFLPPQVLTLLARIFISAHFPHQCLAGLLVGLAAMRLAYLPGPGRVAWLSARPAWLLVVWSLLVPASSFAVYSGLKVRN
jgi:hypothetical protein